jgi:mono/diheme cytochrome c family protein
MRRSLLVMAGMVVAATMLAQSPDADKWQAPPEAAKKQNPLKGKPALAAGGKKIFEKSCTVCHEAGANQVGPHLNSPATQSQSDGALFWKITNGNSRTAMPSFSGLPDGQRWQLVLYIRSLGKK